MSEMSAPVAYTRIYNKDKITHLKFEVNDLAAMQE